MSLAQYVDPIHGHVRVHDDITTTVAILVDCGETVRLQDNYLGPWGEDEAREVGSALIAWAARKRLARRST